MAFQVFATSPRRGNWTPGIQICPILTKFPANNANGNLLVPKPGRAPLPQDHPPKKCRTKISNWLSRTKIAPRFGFVPSKLPIWSEKLAKIKKRPKGERYCPRTPATASSNDGANPSNSKWWDQTLPCPQEGASHYCTPMIIHTQSLTYKTPLRITVQPVFANMGSKQECLHNKMWHCTSFTLLCTG